MSELQQLATSTAGPRIIVALDYPDRTAALQLVDRLDPRLCRLKVGKELFTASGPGLVEELQRRDFKVFLDLKFHDIPNTVAKALEVAARMGVWMVDLHTSGGPRMMDAARKAIDSAGRDAPLLIGVTVLTSMTDDEMKRLGWQRSAQEQVLFLAQMASDCGLDGVVCSAREALALRMALGGDFCLVTPGIRPAGSAADDQRRVMSPAQAIQAGSNYLVIGRPVTQAADPLEVLRHLNSEVDHALD